MRVADEKDDERNMSPADRILYAAVRQDTEAAHNQVVPKPSSPSPSAQPPGASSGELPGTKVLDYIGLALILAPPAVVADMYLRGQQVPWGKAVIASLISWVMGALALVAAHKWQRWRTANGNVVSALSVLEN